MADFIKAFHEGQKNAAEALLRLDHFHESVAECNRQLGGNWFSLSVSNGFPGQIDARLADGRGVMLCEYREFPDGSVKVGDRECRTVKDFEMELCGLLSDCVVAQKIKYLVDSRAAPQ